MQLIGCSGAARPAAMCRGSGRGARQRWRHGPERRRAVPSAAADSLATGLLSTDTWAGRQRANRCLQGPVVCRGLGQLASAAGGQSGWQGDPAGLKRAPQPPPPLSAAPNCLAKPIPRPDRPRNAPSAPSAAVGAPGVRPVGRRRVCEVPRGDEDAPGRRGGCSARHRQGQVSASEGAWGTRPPASCTRPARPPINGLSAHAHGPGENRRAGGRPDHHTPPPPPAARSLRSWADAAKPQWCENFPEVINDEGLAYYETSESQGLAGGWQGASRHRCRRPPSPRPPTATSRLPSEPAVISPYCWNKNKGIYHFTVETK